MTDQNNNKRELAASEKETWFEDFVELTRDLVQCVDSNGRFIYVNQSWLTTLNLTAEEVAGITLWDIIHPDSMKNCKAVFEQIITGKAFGEVEAVFVTKDGTPVAVEGSVSVKLDENGRFDYTRGIFRDVTARKKMEVSLMAAKDEKKALFDAIPDMMFLFSKEGQFVDYNAGDHSQLLLKPEEFMEKHVTETLPPDLAELTLDRLAQLFESEKSQHYEYTLEVVGKKTLYESRLVLCGDGRALAIVRDITERKEAEEALRVGEENLRITLNSIGDAVIATNAEGLVTGMNPVAENLTGWAEDEARGRPLADVFKIYQAGTMEPASNPVLQVMQTGEVIGLANHTLLISKKGDQYHIADSAAPIRDANGKITGVVLVFRDITEEYLMREALKESEACYRTLVYNVPIGIYRSTPGPEGRFLMANPVFLNIFGIADEEELLEHKATDLYINPLERKAFSDQLLKKNKLAKVELKLKKVDGTPIWASVTAQVVRDENNMVQYFDCALEDITERKAAEEALKASEHKYREILSAMEEGYYEVDLAGNFVFCNESFCRMLGCNKEELFGESYKRFYIETKRVFETYNQVYKTGKSVKAIDWPALTWDGRQIYLELSVSLCRDEKGEPIGFRGVARDITERRQADEKIRYLSFHDQLTGLYNRHFLEEEMARLDTERQLPISIMMADLNGLKLVNDTYGHQTGDEMLKRAAAILSSVCRADDLLARFGGDEFVLYLPRTPINDARKISERIEKAYRREMINDVPLSLSTGLAVKTSAEQKLSDLLREAEDNMYRDKLTESRSGKSAIVNSLLQTLTAKSFETEAHTSNMQEVANSIGKKLGLSHSERHRLSLLITLHDIGKINIPEELLLKKGALSDTEWEIMKKHSETGYRVAKATESFAHVAEDILAHHERWDGSGYPQGLKGNKIPLLARIAAIADAYEVMSNGRPYKKAMGRSEIKAEFNNCAGTQFDPELVELFLPIMEADG